MERFANRPRAHHRLTFAPPRHPDPHARREAPPSPCWPPDQHDAPRQTPAPPPSAAEAFALATSGPASPLPFAEPLGRALGVDLSGVEAYLGSEQARAGLAQLGARAATFGRKIAFMDPSPPFELVAHEVAHIAQGQGAAPAEPGGVSSAEEGSEREANDVAGRIARGEPAQVEQHAPGHLVHRSILGFTLGGVLGAALGVTAGGFFGASQGNTAAATATGGVLGGVLGALAGNALSSEARGLTPREIDYGRRIYGDSIAWEDVQVARDNALSTGATKVIANTIYFGEKHESRDVFESTTTPEQEQDGAPPDLSEAGLELLSHELGHIWQYQHGGLAYTADSVAAQADAALSGGDRNGAYGWKEAHAAGLPWEEWNPEQQASAAEAYNRNLLVLEEAQRANIRGEGFDRQRIMIAEDNIKELQPYIDKLRRGEGAPQDSAWGGLAGALIGGGLGALFTDTAQSGSSAGLGLLIGAGAGGLLGGIAGGLANDGKGLGTSIGVGAGIGAGAGAATGAIVGGAVGDNPISSVIATLIGGALGAGLLSGGGKGVTGG